MYKGQIIRTGEADLALELEQRGYEWLTGESDEEEALTPTK
jgi:Fe-S cluster assembly ATPase SufC